MVLVLIEAETFTDTDKLLPVPVIAFGLCTDDNPDVILVYEDLEKAT